MERKQKNGKTEKVSTVKKIVFIEMSKSFIG